MQQRHKSVELLRPSPKSALDKARNQALRDRELELQSTLAHHDTLIRELAHMEVYQTIVDYRPGVYSTDERVTKVIRAVRFWSAQLTFIFISFFLITIYGTRLTTLC